MRTHDHFILTTQDEIDYIRSMMGDADRLRKCVNKNELERNQYNETYKIYKRALWDLLSSCNASIDKV